jgi:DNA gyrase inhibitor GyrI
MSTVEKRRQALARRLGVETQELETLPEETGVGVRFQHQPGGHYAVYSVDEEKQAFRTRVPDVPFLSQIRDDDGKAYNVYISVERAAAN